MRDKDNPALMPFHTQLCNACAPPGNNFTVPAGKTAVIEYVSGVWPTAAETPASLNLFTSVGGVQEDYIFSFSNSEQPDSNGNVIANQQTRIYADASTLMIFGGGSTPGGPPENCTMVLSGYLVTL